MRTINGNYEEEYYKLYKRRIVIMKENYSNEE